MKVARALVAAALIGLMTVTPLSAVLEPGRHETRFPAMGDIAALPVVLHDGTGLVSGIGLAMQAMEDGVRNPAGNQRLLVVSWLGGACDRSVSLVSSPARPVVLRGRLA
jgi:hypothetical protein